MGDLAPVRPLPGRGGPAAIASRVLDELDELVAVMGRTYADEIPEYADLSDAANRDVLATSRRLVRLFCDALIAGDEIAGIDVSFLDGVGHRRLEMGITLDGVLRAFRTAQTVAWDALVAATREGDEEHLVGLARDWIEYVNRAASAMANGYVASSHAHLRRLDAERRALVDALLSANDAGDVAAVAGRSAVAIAREYTPVLLSGPDAQSGIEALIDAAPPDTLAGERRQRVLLLVPGPVDVSPIADAAVVVVAAYGVPVAPGPTLLAEVVALEAQLDAATRSGRTGVFGPDDLPVERLVAGDQRIAASLRRSVLQPLEEHDRDGIFRSTLRTYLATGSIPRTAELEHVHANTASYRLRRVAEVTGLDPRVPTEASVLVLALHAGGDAP